jgi:hypothetical protein
MSQFSIILLSVIKLNVILLRVAVQHIDMFNKNKLAPFSLKKESPG